MSKSITQYCFCHSALRLNNKNHWGPNRIVGLSLVKGCTLNTPRGRTPSKKSCFISPSERRLIKLAFFSSRAIFLDSNLRCFWKKLASLHLRHIAFFICSADPFAERSWNSSADKKLFRKLRFRCFGELRSLKAVQAHFWNFTTSTNYTMSVNFLFFRFLIVLGINYGSELFTVLDKGFLVQTLLGWILWKVLDFLWEKITK